MSTYAEFMNQANPIRSYGQRWKAFCQTVSERKAAAKIENDEAQLARAKASREPEQAPDSTRTSWAQIMHDVPRSAQPLKGDPWDGYEFGGLR